MSKSHSKARRLLGFVLLALHLVSPATGNDVDWENPIFQDADDAVRAALVALAETTPGEYSARELFTLFTVSSAERPNDPRFENVRRQIVDSFLVTYPAFLEDARARRTLEAFLAEVEDNKDEMRQTLEDFSFPPLLGLTYLKLVENVDELQYSDLQAAEPGAQIQGVTYFCRFVVLPLSYITARGIEELRGSALEPGVNVHATLRTWQRESFRSLVGTFRHEMVHVWVNSSLGPPYYRDEARYPDWFSEGSATFLAADVHTGLSERYKGYQNLFFYLVERHGVEPLRAFYQRSLAGATADESLEATYGIATVHELRARQERWHTLKDVVNTVLVLALLVVVLAAFVTRSLPIFGSIQLWLAAMLAYSTVSGFCEVTQALNGASAVRAQQGVFAAFALFLAVRGLRSVRRSFRAARA